MTRTELIRRCKTFICSSQLTPAMLLTWAIGLFYAKFLIFDLVWAKDTTFSGLQFPIGWLNKLALATLLASPIMFWRSKGYLMLSGLVVDALIVVNLMYFRTYFTIIPLTSYGMASNMLHFQESVWAAFRWIDILFPLTTAAVAWRLWRVDIKSIISHAARYMWKRIAWLFVAPLAIVFIIILCQGGMRKSYEARIKRHPTIGATIYTIPGVMLHQWLLHEPELTPEGAEKISTWLDKRPVSEPLPFDIEERDNCIIILCESLESWVIGATVEDQEITPFLNSCLADSATLYAPHVQSQAWGARSIDGQLIPHTGLLPVSYGSFSTRFPGHEYPSIDKAFKEKYPANGRSMSFTVDKKVVCNVGVVARDFGYDVLLDKPYFVNDVSTGPSGRLGDESFLRQSYQKIKNDELWPDSAHVLLQCVTYSGHTPFLIPDSEKRISFSNDVPEIMRRYMEVANYTDRSIAAFVDSIRSNPKFDNTMIVITGDHEAMAIDRNELLKNPIAAQWMSPNQFLPLMVLNSPVGLRYDEVMGHVDVYPTLLDLLGLDDYYWRGLGQSILRPGKRPYAVTPLGQVVGNTDGASPQEIEHAKQAFEISDMIISHDYFKDNNQQK